MPPAARLRTRRAALAPLHGQSPSRSSSPSSATSRTRPRARTRTPGLHSIEVNVLVHGDYLLTVHRERVSLPQLLPGYNAEGRSEQYVVYAVLDAMVATAFDALSDTELALEGLQTSTTETGNAAGADGNAAGDQPAADDDAAPARAPARDLRADRRGDRPGREPRAPTTSATSSASTSSSTASSTGSTPPPTRWRS